MYHPRRIHGEGPQNALIMIVGSEPGWQEAKQGRVFAGKIGDELDRFLDGDRLPARKDVFLTNLYREYRGDHIHTAADDLAADERDLLRELHAVQPSLIVPLGREATRWFLGDIDIDGVQGIAWELNICYACAKHGRKVLATSAKDERLLAVAGRNSKSGVWLADIPLQELAGAPTGVHVHKRTNTEWAGTRPSVFHATLCQSSPFRGRNNKDQQPTCKIPTYSVSMGTPLHPRNNILLSHNPDSTLPAVRSGNRETACCPICAGTLRQTITFPIVHIASAFHNAEMAAYVVSGFTQLAAYLDGKIEPRKLFDDTYLEPQYEEITTLHRLQAVLQRAELSSWDTGRDRGRRAADMSTGRVHGHPQIAIDTEGWPFRPWSLQFSSQPGTAFCIRATRRDLLDAFGDYLRRVRPRLTYHSALHDIGMMRVLGLPTDLPFDDTMVMAYLLQLEPQGLKPLCLRHCGMQMQSYDDVLGDASQRLAVDYLSALWSIEQHEYEARCQVAFWQEIDKGRRIAVYPTLSKTALHKAVERTLRSPNARKLWRTQVEDIQVDGYNCLGTLPEPTLDHVPLAAAIYYGARDADGTARVLAQLGNRLDALGLRDVYHLELSTYPLIERMSHVGLKPDLPHFRQLSHRLASQLQLLQIQLQDATGCSEFNGNSGDQVADYLFRVLNLESIKNTRSGRGSTNDKILEALEHEHPEHPVITTIRTYRELYKLKSAFVDRLPDYVRRWPYDGRVHSTFRTTRVVTGRLAASDPNALAMPKHGQFAREFRRGWVPEIGHVLCEWDLSQIELRVLAHLSQDPVLLTAFRSGVDLHAQLAQRIFGGRDADHKKGTTRLAAKAINFGIPMGLTCRGLSVELRKNGVDADEDDAQRWLDETMALYKGVPVYQDRMAAEAARTGYVRCLSGRIRYIGGIRSPSVRVVEEARRFAFATPVQEGAQYIMKIAESKVWDMLVSYWRDKRWVEPLLQCHDALLLECEDDPALARDVNAQMVGIMTTLPPNFTVPITTSGEWGSNWCAYDEKASYSPSTPGNGDMIPFEAG